MMLVVAAAMIDANGSILVQRRPDGDPLAGQWEFPGGKVGCGESPEMALCRELSEELGIAVLEDQLAPIAFAHDYPDRELIILLYTCRKWHGELKPIFADAVKWVTVAQLQTLDMPKIDIDLVEQIMGRL